MKDWHQSQRGYFAGALFDLMLVDQDIYVVTADLGFGQFDKLQNMFPERFINVGASEQTMIDVAVGLALSGKKPICYTITSFFLRAAESLALYVSGEQINVRLVGGGRDDDYKHDGPSHDATNTQNFIESLNIKKFYPENKEDVPAIIEDMITSDKPSFVSLKR